MRRRWIPVLAAVLVGLAGLLPTWDERFSPQQANRWVLALTALVSVGTAGIVWWMRRLMTRSDRGEDRLLTIFGLALCDWFRALALFFLAMALLFGGVAAAGALGRPLTSGQVAILRALLAGGATFAAGTGFGVAWRSTSPPARPMRSSPSCRTGV
jgi:hypothetical protein